MNQITMDASNPKPLNPEVRKDRQILLYDLKLIESKQKDLLKEIQTCDDELNSTFPHDKEEWKSSEGYSFANCHSYTLLRFLPLMMQLNVYIESEPEYLPLLSRYLSLLPNPMQYRRPEMETLQLVATDMQKTFRLLRNIERSVLIQLSPEVIQTIRSSTFNNIDQYKQMLSSNPEQRPEVEIAYHHWHAMVRLSNQIKYLKTKRQTSVDTLKEIDQSFKEKLLEFARMLV